MKLSLPALAALALVAASNPAVAQSNVTLYGSVDTAFTHLGGTVSQNGVSSGGGGSVGSKFGFKGTEDLGSGMKASFVFESGLETSSGGFGVPRSNNNVSSDFSGLFGRRATVSLESSLGEIRLGRDLAASFLNDVIYDPFLTYGVGSSVSFPMGIVRDGQSASSLFRVSNAISYFTPKGLGGFSGQLMFAPSETKTANPTTKNGSYAGGRVAFDQGPISVSSSYGYSRQTFSTVPLVRSDKSTGNIGGSYDFGVVKAMAEYSRYKSLAENATGANLKTTVYTLGLVAPMGASTFKLGYSHGKQRFDAPNASEPSASKLALGYIYSFSKRTSVYTTLARLKNRNGAAFNVGDGGVAGLGNSSSPNSSSTGFDLGINHSF